MNNDWQIKKLGEVCKVIAGQSPEGKYYNSERNGMPFYQGKKEFGKKYIGEPTTWTTNITKEAETDDILMSVRAPVGPVNFATQKICIGRGLAAIRAGKEINKDFLFGFLLKHENEIVGNAGAVFDSISKTQIENIPIPLPPLPEQHRIVSILDKCFSAIEQSRNNAEQNLKNAKELFESYLQRVFENEKEDWEIKCLDELGTITSSKRIYKSEYIKEGVPFYRTKEIKEISNGKPISLELFISRERYTEIKKTFGVPKIGDLLLSAVGTIGEIMVIETEEEFYFKDGNIVWFKDFKSLDTNYLKYALTAFVEKIKSLAIGAAYSALTIEKLNKYKISFPKSIKDQQSIVRKLDALRAETQKLEAVYQKKITDLEELRKSILGKAFSGELTASSSTSLSVAKIIPLQKIEGISPTDLQAGITAMALQKHIECGRENSFGHVKAEKIIHLTEYILGIDLERNPVKDAAGPNDFPRAKKVEHRAKMAGYYTVSQKTASNEVGYFYTQGRSFNAHINKTQNCLGNKSDTLVQVLDLITPLDTQQAEIVTTLYAAWNNLLLRNDNFSDEEIVTEARENWHEEKMKIPRDKFFKALNWMKKQELLMPKCNGKIVTTK